jgi:hypothetical protein
MGKVTFQGQYDGTNRPTVKWNTAGGALGGSETALYVKSIKASIEKMAEIDDQTDENGGCVGFIKKPKGPKKKATIEMIVQADTLAHAIAQLVAPPDLTEVWLENFVSLGNGTTNYVGEFNAKWVYKTGMKVDIGEDDTAKISCELYLYNTASATLLAATT